MRNYLFTSLTRISDLATSEFDVVELPRARWATGDYVVARVLDASGYRGVELPDGRMTEAMESDLIVGAFGARAATLEAVGDWREIEGQDFHALTSAGLFGKLTSRSPFLPKLMSIRYVGHTVREGERVTMAGCVQPAIDRTLDVPVILIIGTSMSSGKTTSGRLIIRLLSRMGLDVVGAKFTGAARYRDVLSFKDAGASRVFDFVDAGVTSTLGDPEEVGQAMRGLVSRIAAADPDVVVVEAGASPLEPYNGEVAVELLGANVRFVLLCASDPYAVLGVTHAFGRDPDLVAGGAANTTAGINLVKKLTGLPALNLVDRASRKPLMEALLRSLGPVGDLQAPPA